jgi:hypothetical protein
MGVIVIERDGKLIKMDNTLSNTCQIFRSEEREGSKVEKSWCHGS